MHWEAMKELLDKDTDTERSSKVIRNVEVDLLCYKEVLTEMKEVRIQPTLDSFFKKTDDS
jgi:endonuclease/exonuclease/phosphatase family metal-dependent hydrolase